MTTPSTTRSGLIADRLAKAMQDAREEIGATEQQRIAFAYAEAAMRHELPAALTPNPDDALRDALVERLRARVKIETACGNRTENPNNHVRLMDEAADALERLSSDGWMPIESAPKDGTRIMGASWNENCGWRQFVLFWSDRFLPDGVEPFWQFGGCKEHPTHWRPLPEPPAMRAAAPLVEKAKASPPAGI